MTVSLGRTAVVGATTLFLLGVGGTAWAAQTPTTTALARQHPAMRQVLHPGSRGHWVMTLQADLDILGYWAGPVDGIFGPKTEAGLKAFEVRHGFAARCYTTAAVWQDILAGFGLVPSYPRHPRKSKPTTTLKSTAVLPAHFPAPASLTPVDEPSLPNPSAGLQGQFSPSIHHIDGRPVLKAFHMVATAYGPSLKDNYPYGPVDYFGQPLENGMVAVDPRVIPLRSVVFVTGYHDNYLPQGGFLGQAMDTGGAIQGDRVDLFINASETVINDFGVQEVTLYQLGR